MMRARKTTCCGMFELYDLQEDWDQTFAYDQREYAYIRLGKANLEKGARAALKALKKRSPPNNWDWPALVVFTDVTDVKSNKGGKNLVAAIKKFKLGKVVISDQNLNPNSGNRVRGYIWTPDPDAMYEFYHRKGS